VPTCTARPTTVARLLPRAGEPGCRVRQAHDHDIRAKTARKFRRTTDSNHDLPVAANLLDRQFDPEAPNEAWVADITCIPTREGWLYLAAVEDLYSRRVVGWSMADHLESRLVVEALALAVERRLPGAGLLAHSDRGSQYASDHYQRLLARHGIACSMSRRADCWDNAPLESFFASVKKESVHDADFATRAEAVRRSWSTSRSSTTTSGGTPRWGTFPRQRTNRKTVNPLSTFRGELHRAGVAGVVRPACGSPFSARYFARAASGASHTPK
jgi:transposase InsO family protein